MALFPFSIADIDEPEQIRVVLYASGRMGHAPLNALLKKNDQDIEALDKKLNKNSTQLTKHMDALEQQLNVLKQQLDALEQQLKESMKELKDGQQKAP
ncbi:hypothetical protein [Bartonella machadoae]|uniref:hypothetical protein n=1 Tax=Bartonella machadoae TaxID=2893471 RepID=UPI001F4C9AB3|nr:hypothetical protein [Bartonella machadoae]UNE53829.1 hypothetical protein LNM86_09495 [Bartonella machadoae]